MNCFCLCAMIHETIGAILPCLQEYQPSRQDQGANIGATAAKRKWRTPKGGGGKSNKKAKKSNKAAAAAAALAAAEAASLEEESEEGAKLARQQRVRTDIFFWALDRHPCATLRKTYQPRWCLWYQQQMHVMPLNNGIKIESIPPASPPMG